MRPPSGIDEHSAGPDFQTGSLARILFLAVDAGDKDLILGWAREGFLPTFRSLLETSAWGPTQNPTGLFVGAIWPSFWTGLSPARHGRYCYSQLRTGTYDHYAVTPKDTAGEPFWNALSASGRRVAVLDVPKTAPSPRINGIQVVDWGTHDPELGFCTWPQSVASEIEELFGSHPVRQCDTFPQPEPEGRTSLRDALIRGVQKKTELAAHFLQRGGWDLFLTVFAESHCVGHQCWHIHDPNHPRHDPKMARSIGDPVRDVYVAIDKAVGNLLALSGPDTTVFILASHGMGPHYDGTFLLDEILRRLFGLPPPVREKKRALVRGLERVWRRLPAAPRVWFRPLSRRARQLLEAPASPPDLGSWSCFSTSNNDAYGGIRVNVAGREPQGLIRPGPEFDAFCEALTRDLSAFVNLDTGKPLVKRVLRTADLYQGERLRDLPDLLVEWDRDAPISRIHSPKTGVIEGTFSGIRTGDHKAEGLVFVRGPGIAPRRLERRVDITQFAPTIASLLDVPLPEGYARPIDELTRPGLSTIDP